MNDINAEWAQGAFEKLASVFHSVHFIDLKSDTAKEIKSHPVVSMFVFDGEGAQRMMWDVMKATCTETDLPRVIEFTDFSTLPQRVADGQPMQTVFRGSFVGYVRARFIPASFDEDGTITQAIFVVEVIDDLVTQAEESRRESHEDALTGLKNKRAYNEDIVAFDTDVHMRDFVYVSLDANGLKQINDNQGHEAGDEYIRGVAECLKRCLGAYGSVYRVGGDEFAALINIAKGKIPALRQDLDRAFDLWSGQKVSHLSVSYGLALREDNPDCGIQELAAISDKMMYEAKAEYYKNKGVDRRGQNLAYMALVKSYTKILEANLSKDTFRIIQMNEREKNISMGYHDKLSEWLSDFARSGSVHPDDLSQYLEETNFDHLREHFKRGNTAFALRYRRLIEGKWHKALLEFVPAQSYTHDDQVVYVLVKEIG